MPNEALREELERMTPEEREAYLNYLEELAKGVSGAPVVPDPAQCPATTHWTLDPGRWTTA
ncbi:MAG: hypothetical protein R2855_12605 [Thermomicrobiales bacterium]